MADDLGLFAPPSTGRYTARKGADPWTDLDRMLLYPVLAACGTEHAYFDTCLWLCEFLGRPPVFPDTKRPTTAEKQAAAAKILELRTVTVGLSPNGSLAGLAGRLFFGTRNSKPWTWGELRLAKSWSQKHLAAVTSRGEWRGCITPTEFLLYLDRGPTNLGDLDEVYRCVRNRSRLEANEDRRRNPAHIELRVGRAVKLVREADDRTLLPAWENLLQALTPPQDTP